MFIGQIFEIVLDERNPFPRTDNVFFGVHRGEFYGMSSPSIRKERVFTVFLTKVNSKLWIKGEDSFLQGMCTLTPNRRT